MTPPEDERRAVTVTRVGPTHYVASNGSASIEFGRGEGLLTPVELLLAALGGCAAIDVDVVTSRRSEPEEFRVQVAADKVVEDGASHLTNVDAAFDLTFPDDERGREAAALVDRLIQLSHDKDCTVSRTIERATEVRMRQGDPTSP